MKTFKMKNGFTLAEVLITLGVIGIVAAMTIPNLVQSYKKKEVETKLVKFYSMMNNAIKMAEVDYGPQSTWTDYHIDHNVDNENNQYLYDKGDKYDILIKKYFEPYLKITSSEDFYDIPVIDKGLNQPQRIYYLPDGSAFSFGLHENRELFFYPFDPKKCLKTENPNGKCRFEFVFIPCDNTKNGDPTNWFPFNIGNGMQPSVRYLDNNGELSLKNDSTFGCYNSKAVYSGSYCCALIQRNNWKIPEDYPYKF